MPTVIFHSHRAIAASACVILSLSAACGSASSGPRDTIQGTPAGPTVPVPAELWRPPAGSTPPTGTFMYVEMDSTFSPGVTSPRTIVPATGLFAVSAIDGALTISATDTTSGLKVRGVFTTMLGHPLIEEGYYRDLRGAANADPLKGSLDVTLDAHACGSITGWFVIDHVFYFNGRLTTLDLRFEQRCPEFAAPMHGQIHWTENLT